MVFTNRKLVFGVLAAAAVQSVQGVPVWGQCGGKGWTGGTTCDAGSYCQYSNEFYSQCVPGTASSTTTSGAATPTSTALRGLHSLAKAKGRYFGTATDQIWNNNDAAYLALTGNPNEFGVNTPGNQLKWDATEKSRGVFTYTNGDAQVAWAKNHSQVVRGHTLVWHSQLPSWVSNGGFDSATLISIMQNHISNVAGRYKGQLYAWDVVNEMFNDDGTWRTSVFYTTIGPSYIAIALRAARAADPTAKLYLNEYNTDWTGSKSDAMYNLAKDLKAQGVPLDGIGFQAHLIVNSFSRTFQANYQRFADLGLDVAITELDIRYTLPATAALVTAQAENYKYVMNSCLAVSRCVGVTVWDTSDDYSWIPSVFPGQGEALLFDKNKKPKSAYYAVADALAAATLRCESIHRSNNVNAYVEAVQPESFAVAVPNMGGRLIMNYSGTWPTNPRPHLKPHDLSFFHYSHKLIVQRRGPSDLPARGMPIFGCFTLSTFCGPTPPSPKIDIAHVGNAFKTSKQRTHTPDEEFFVTFGWPAGLPFEVHQYQIEHIRTSAVELYDVALRELGGAMAWSSEIGYSIDSIKQYIKKIRRFADDWARLNRMEAYLRERDIKGEVTEQHTHLYMFAKDFQELIDLGAWNSRHERARALDLAALDVTLGVICRTPEDLDCLKREDKLLVQWFMQHLQRKIATTPKHLTEPFLSALLSIHRRTRYLPPLADLAHEISRHDTFPFMRGGQSDIWRGSWLGLPVALKLVRNVSRRSGATVRRMSIGSSAPTEPKGKSDNDTICPGGDAARAFKREAEIWRQLMHDNVHPFLGVWVNMGDVYLVSPFMEHGDAAEWVRTRNDTDRLKLLLEIAQGIEYLHLRSPAVIHGDLRLANVLISDSGSACITDFGLARVLEGLTLTPVSQQLGVAGATRWMARELLLPTPPPMPDSSSDVHSEPESEATVTRETDVWSWGMTALEAMTAQPPYFHRRRDTQVMLDIIGGVLPSRPRTGFLSRSDGDALWALMERCWKTDPRERPSSSEVVAEMWKLQRRI